MRVRGVLGLVAGAILILSSGAHSFLGWSGLRGRLTAAQVPPDLLLGVEVGWQFGGVAILAFGVIVVAQAVRRLRGETVWALPERTIALAYLGFGIWALAISDMNPFFLVFIVPGILLAISALPWGRREA